MWRRFLTDERERGTKLEAALITADDGRGALRALALKVRTAADYAEEIPEPDHALPCFDSKDLQQILAPQRPPPLKTE